ncbi:MAG: hypothetical protein AAF674_20575 [Pseudomonadota bacterium]
MPERLFALGKAAEAAGIDPGFLSQRINRGDPVLDEERDIAATGRGSARMFSLDTILQIAIAERLRRLGVPFKDGLKAACTYVLVGGNSVKGEREPGQPFTSGRTLLVHSPAGTGVVNTHRKPGDSTLFGILCDALNAPSNDFTDGDYAVAIVDIGGIHRHVSVSLGISA